jgi:hypothetical protein
MKKLALFSLLALSFGSAQAAIVTYYFNNLGANANIAVPALGGPSTASDSDGASFGVSSFNLRLGLDDVVSVTGSGTLSCASPNGVNACASNATSEPSTVAGHASGLGVGGNTNGRINAGETITFAPWPVGPSQSCPSKYPA